MWPDFGHGRRREGGVAQHVHARQRGRLHAQPVHAHPAVADADRARVLRQIAGALRRMRLSTSALTSSNSSLAVPLANADFFSSAFGRVFEDAAVAIPKAFSNSAFFDWISGWRRAPAPGFRLGRLQVGGDHAGPLVGPGRAAVGHLGWRCAKAPPSFIASICWRSATVCAPAFQACGTAPARLAGEAAHGFGHEVDAGRDHQAVVGERAAVGQLHLWRPRRRWR